MKQIYVEWRDAVGKTNHTASDGDFPKSTLLKGTTWLIEEDATDVLVAAFAADDGGYMDMIAIPKACIEKREEILHPTGITKVTS